MESTLVPLFIFGVHSDKLSSRVLIHADFELNPDPQHHTRMLAEPACRGSLQSTTVCNPGRFSEANGAKIGLISFTMCKHCTQASL